MSTSGYMTEALKKKAWLLYHSGNRNYFLAISLWNASYSTNKPHSPAGTDLCWLFCLQKYIVGQRGQPVSSFNLLPLPLSQIIGKGRYNCCRHSKTVTWLDSWALFSIFLSSFRQLWMIIAMCTGSSWKLSWYWRQSIVKLHNYDFLSFSKLIGKNIRALGHTLVIGCSKTMGSVTAAPMSKNEFLF